MRKLHARQRALKAALAVTVAQQKSSARRVRAVTATVDTTAGKLDALKSKIQALRDGLRAGSFTELHGKFGRERALARLAKLKAQVAGAQQTVQVARRALRTEKRRLAAIRRRVSTQRARVERASAVIAARVARVKAMKGQWKTTVVAKLGGARRTLATAEAALAATKRKSRAIQSRQTTLRAASRVLKTQIRAALASAPMRSKVAQRLAALHKQQKAAQRSARRTAGKLSALERRIAKLIAGLQAGAFETAAGSMNREEARQALARVQRKVAAVRARLTDERSLAGGLQQQSRTLKAQATAAERASLRQVKALRAQLAGVRRQRKAVRARIVAQMTAVVAAEQRVSKGKAAVRAGVKAVAQFTDAPAARGGRRTPIVRHAVKPKPNPKPVASHVAGICGARGLTGKRLAVCRELVRARDQLMQAERDAGKAASRVQMAVSELDRYQSNKK